MAKEKLIIDLEGVVLEYGGGSFTTQNIFGKPLPKVKEFLTELQKNYSIILKTKRQNIKTIESFLRSNRIPFDHIMTDKNDHEGLYLSDICLNFRGNFDETKKDLENWYHYSDKIGEGRVKRKIEKEEGENFFSEK